MNFYVETELMGMRTKTTLAFLALGFAASMANPSYSAECYAVTIRDTVIQGRGVSIPKGENSRIIGYEKSTDEVVVYRSGYYMRRDFGNFSPGCSTLGLP